MKLLFESWRKHTNLLEEQLLIEGRISDAERKYPELAKKREELDGESLLDTLIAADPSGNQKYLMWAARTVRRGMDSAETEAKYRPFWGKLWPEDADDDLYSPWGIAKNLAGDLTKFHKLLAFIPAEKRDINAIQNSAELTSVVNIANMKKETKEGEKQKSAEEREKAAGESTIVEKNDYYTMIRPESKHASCYYGKGATWCISATQSENYFDSYTSEGKTFYFVFFANLSNVNKYKKIALVVNSAGDYEEAFDAENNNLNPDEVIDAIIQNMLYEKQDTGALEMFRYTEGDRYTDEPLDRDKADFIKVVKELGISWDDALAATKIGFDGEAENANSAVRDKAALWFRDMKREAELDASENPAGPKEEEYEELLRAYEREASHIQVSLNFPYETGASQTYWEASIHVDVGEIMLEHPIVRDNRLKWRINPEETTDEQDEEIKEAVDNALTTVDLWPDEVEQSYDSNMEFYVRISNDGGGLDEFESYLDNISYLDNKFDPDFIDALIKELMEKELIGRDPKEEEYWPDPEEKKKQLELPLQENKRRIRIVFRSKK